MRGGLTTSFTSKLSQPLVFRMEMPATTTALIAQVPRIALEELARRMLENPGSVSRADFEAALAGKEEPPVAGALQRRRRQEPLHRPLRHPGAGRPRRQRGDPAGGPRREAAHERGRRRSTSAEVRSAQWTDARAPPRGTRRHVEALPPPPLDISKNTQHHNYPTRTGYSRTRSPGSRRRPRTSRGPSRRPRRRRTYSPCL